MNNLSSTPVQRGVLAVAATLSLSACDIGPTTQETCEMFRARATQLIRNGASSDTEYWANYADECTRGRLETPNDLLLITKALHAVGDEHTAITYLNYEIMKHKQDPYFAMQVMLLKVEILGLINPNDPAIDEAIESFSQGYPDYIHDPNLQLRLTTLSLRNKAIQSNQAEPDEVNKLVKLLNTEDYSFDAAYHAEALEALAPYAKRNDTVRELCSSQEKNPNLSCLKEAYETAKQGAYHLTTNRIKGKIYRLAVLIYGAKFTSTEELVDYVRSNLASIEFRDFRAWEGLMNGAVTLSLVLDEEAKYYKAGVPIDNAWPQFSSVILGEELGNKSLEIIKANKQIGEWLTTHTPAIANHAISDHTLQNWKNLAISLDVIRELEWGDHNEDTETRLYAYFSEYMSHIPASYISDKINCDPHQLEAQAISDQLSGIAIEAKARVSMLRGDQVQADCYFNLSEAIFAQEKF